MMGGQNCHAEIMFDDNVKWLAQPRLSSASSPPLEARDYILRSEAATMTFLQKHTRIPSPRIYDWACESDPSNPLGRAGYILMEKMEGKPLDWQGTTELQKETTTGRLNPFHSSLEGASALTRSYLAMIASSKIEATCPIETHLMHRFRLDILNDAGEDMLSDKPKLAQEELRLAATLHEKGS
ncbi:hypothetical protein Daesc_010147 [Daldinia eschscholtzii]|uniref:Uncharacterized protein n=1 Tax=Daldinia eschscholtzii TaxID=292717 RepID=A0AAX6M853_9PEZI